MDLEIDFACWGPTTSQLPLTTRSLHQNLATHGLASYMNCIRLLKHERIKLFYRSKWIVSPKNECKSKWIYYRYTRNPEMKQSLHRSLTDCDLAFTFGLHIGLLKHICIRPFYRDIPMMTWEKIVSWGWSTADPSIVLKCTEEFNANCIDKLYSHRANARSYYTGHCLINAAMSGL